MDINYYKKLEPFFDEWTIKTQIGEGQFGKVFEIERIDRDKTYKDALKIITIPGSEREFVEVAHEMGEQNAIEYFRASVNALTDEIKLLSALVGKTNIVSYNDHKVIENPNGHSWDIVIRMQLLTPLKKYLQQKGTVSRRDIIKLGMDMCTALQVCQRHNIVHRDIKLENILVSDDGDFKLGDFGVARMMEEGNTQHLSRKGTDAYMAPEMVRMDDDCDSRVDIYSLGIVLYKLLNANRFPFMPTYPAIYTTDDVTLAMKQRISGKKMKAPLNADGRLAEIVLKACAFDKRDRYSAPGQMLEELRAINYTAEEARILYVNGDCIIIPTERNGFAVNDDTPTEVMPTPGNAPRKQFHYTPETPPGYTPPSVKPEKKFAKFAIAAICAIVVFAGAFFFLGRTTSQKSETESSSTEESKTVEATIAPAIIEAEPTEAPTIAPTATPVPAATAEPTAQPDNVDLGAQSSYNMFLQYLENGDIKNAIRLGRDLISVSSDNVAAISSDGTVLAAGRVASKTIGALDWDGVSAIYANSNNIVGLCEDGTAVATGKLNLDDDSYQGIDLSDWTDLTAVSANESNIVGLCKDHSVRYYGTVWDGESYIGFSLRNWSSIVSIFADESNIIGIRSDGTALSAGYLWDGWYNGKHQYISLELIGWDDLSNIANNEEMIIGLCEDGSVLADGKLWLSDDIVTPNLRGWSDVASIALSPINIVGVRENGFVLSKGTICTADDTYQNLDLSDWSKVVTIETTRYGAAGLREDGSVYATGMLYLSNGQYERLDLNSWQDIVAIALCDNCIIGLRSDGIILCQGDWESSVKSWDLW